MSPVLLAGAAGGGALAVRWECSFAVVLLGKNLETERHKNVLLSSSLKHKGVKIYFGLVVFVFLTFNSIPRKWLC